MKNYLHTLPVSYDEVVQSVGIPGENIQDMLFRLDITHLAKFVKRKFNDERSVSEIMLLIVEELLDGEWDYRSYLCKKKQATA